METGNKGNIGTQKLEGFANMHPQFKVRFKSV